jgi:hypothetical protein
MSWRSPWAKNCRNLWAIASGRFKTHPQKNSAITKRLANYQLYQFSKKVIDIDNVGVWSPSPLLLIF